MEQQSIILLTKAKLIKIYLYDMNEIDIEVFFQCMDQTVLHIKHKKNEKETLAWKDWKLSKTMEEQRQRYIPRIQLVEMRKLRPEYKVLLP